MNKILLDYNPSTGELRDPATKEVICNWFGLQTADATQAAPTSGKTETKADAFGKVANTIIALKNNGIEMGDIKELLNSSGGA